MTIYYGLYEEDKCLFLSENYTATQIELSKKIKEPSPILKYYYTQPCHKDGFKITTKELEPIIIIEKDADKDYKIWNDVKDPRFTIKIVESEKDLKEHEYNNYYILNSSMQFCKKAKNKAKVYFEELKYNEYITELTAFGIPCLNSNFMIAKTIDIKRNWEFYFNKFETNCLFIRPIIDKKFPSLNYGLFSGPDQLTEYGVKGQAIIAKSQRIKEEYRFFISYHKIIASSMYKQNDNVIYSTNVPKNVISLAEIVSSLTLKNISKFVLDIAVSYDGTPSILEINCWSSSGIYSCNPLNIALATLE
jgi:hypothetical protein